MNAPVVEHDAFHWPMPPFLQPASAARPSADCMVELDSGEVRSGRLLGLRPDRQAITLRNAQRATESIDLTHVRSIRLATLLRLVLNEEALHRVGAEAGDVAQEKGFVVSLRDGAKLEGRTRGFVRNADGLYLNLIQADPALTAAWFVPTAQLQDVRIGPPLGETLASRNVVSRETLALALERQGKLRTERLGDYLTDRAIVSVGDLLRALDKQVHQPNVRLGEFLLREGLITPQQLEQALAVQSENRQRRLGDILVDMGAVSTRDVQVALSEKLGIPFVNVRDFVIDPQTLRLVGSRTALDHQVLPLVRSGELLVVAVENPLAMDYVQDVQFASGISVIPVIANGADLRLRIAQEYGGADAASVEPAQYESEHNVEELASQLAREAPRPERPAPSAETRVMDNALVRLVNKIIIDAHAQGASDIHIESNPRNRGTRVRLRKDGDLEDYLELQPSFRNALVSRVKIMAGMDISEHRHAQDGKIDFGRFGPLPIELRVVVIPTANGLEDVVMRILGGVEPLPVDSLGLCARDLSVLKEMVTRSYGLILVCGPTGSGKTTTLHSVLHHINRPDLKIWTAEDPVEITQPGLRQMQINARIGWTFADAMRSFLRADPDVIMVGEMRDVETAKIAIEASLTGHLVFSTLHTNSAAESIVRLLDLGMDRFNFADALIGVLSQRLARKLCPRCRRPHQASDAEVAQLAQEYCTGTALDPVQVAEAWLREHAGKIVLHEAAGCADCRGGYRGRVGLYELLEATPQVKDLVRAHGTVPQLVAASQQAGMRLLRQDGIDKVLRGLLDLASARSAFT